MCKIPFFIVGSPRSGTTLLERLLNRHSQLCVPPETAYFHLLNRFGLMGRETTRKALVFFVSAYLQTEAARLLNLGDSDVVQRDLLSGARTYTDVFLNLLGLLRESDEKSRIGEKTPHHLLVADYIGEQLPNAQFICVMRDGRAVVKSRLKHPKWEHNLLAAARVWRADARKMRVLLENKGSERVHLVRYEQLITNPEYELKTICDFLGETFEATMLEPDLVRAGVPEKYNEYYQQSWMAKSTSDIDPVRADAWRGEYMPHELALVEKIMASELEHFGYELYARRGLGWLPLLLKESVRHVEFRIRRYGGKLCTYPGNMEKLVAAARKNAQTLPKKDTLR